MGKYDKKKDYFKRIETRQIMLWENKEKLGNDINKETNTESRV